VRLELSTIQLTPKWRQVKTVDVFVDKTRYSLPTRKRNGEVKFAGESKRR